MSLGTAMLAGCAQYHPACPSDRNPDPLDGYSPRYLSSAECVTLAAAAEVMIAECPGIISAAEVARRADRLLTAMDAPAGARARLAIAAVESLAGVFSFELKSFSELSLEHRREVLDKLVHGSGLPRDITRVFKMLTVVPYYSHPEVRQSIGFVDFEQRKSFSTLPVFAARKAHPEPISFG
ncbi:MAG TPA: hypothetical protein VGM29_07030 [Polyangiaceae bacterium]